MIDAFGCIILILFFCNINIIERLEYQKRIIYDLPISIDMEILDILYNSKYEIELFEKCFTLENN